MTIHDELLFEVLVDGIDTGMELQEKLATDGTVDRKFLVPDLNHPHIVPLTIIKELMEDHEGRFSVPIPVTCERCVARWDVKIGVQI
jgi:hypothetical protein